MHNFLTHTHSREADFKGSMPLSTVIRKKCPMASQDMTQFDEKVLQPSLQSNLYFQSLGLLGHLWQLVHSWAPLKLHLPRSDMWPDFIRPFRPGARLEWNDLVTWPFLTRLGQHCWRRPSSGWWAEQHQRSAEVISQGMVSSTSRGHEPRIILRMVKFTKHFWVWKVWTNSPHGFFGQNLPGEQNIVICGAGLPLCRFLTCSSHVPVLNQWDGMKSCALQVINTLW